MNLKELVEFTRAAEEAVNRFDASYETVQVLIHGEHGHPRKAILEGVLRGIDISIDLPVRSGDIEKWRTT